MTRKMVIKFEDDYLWDYYRASAIMKKFKRLINKYKKSVIVNMYEIGEPHKAYGYNKFREYPDGVEYEEVTYRDLMVFYNDNYEKTVMKCISPYEGC